MRVLFVTWDGPQVSYLESLFLPIFKGLKSHGFHFDILQFRWGGPQQEEAVRDACAAAGLGYRAVKVWRWGGSIGPFATAILGGRHVRRAIRHFNTDVLMPRSVLPSIATLMGRGPALRPVLLDSDGLEIDERVEFSGMRSTGLAYRILRDAEAQMVRRSHSVLVRTAAGRDILGVRAGPPILPDKFHIVANGRDENVFTPSNAEARRAVRAELGISNQAPLLIYVGSIGGKYRTRTVGELAMQLRKLRPDTRLLVLSGSPEAARSELLGPLPELEPITTIFRASPEEVPRYIAAADAGTAFITPTFSMRSVAPVKTAEYLLCGVPLVGTAEVGDNEAAIAADVFFDERRGLEHAAHWIAEAVLANRDAYRERARSVGLDHFSLGQSIRGYLAALRTLEPAIMQGTGRKQTSLA